MLRNQPFDWRMKNGAVIAVLPSEGERFAESVGWTCFTMREWEPHVEACIRSRLRQGDIAMDVGANIGYFSAVMAQCVGATGTVWAFEPVPPSFALLDYVRLRNSYHQLHCVNIALADDASDTILNYDPSLGGNATRYGGPSTTTRPVVARTARLDDLVAGGTVTVPRLMKLDVEGDELATLRGAAATLKKAQPDLIIECNERTMREAGWTPIELSQYLVDIAPYRFYNLSDRGSQLDLPSLKLDRDQYIDVLAIVAPGEA